MTAQTSFRAAFFDGRGELRQGWRALAFFVLYPLICLPLLLFLGRFPLGATAVMALGAFLAGTLLLRLEHRPWRAVGLRFGKAWALEFLLGGLGGVLLIATAAALAWGVGGLRFGAGAPGAGRAALWGLLFFTLVAFHEELAFRGYAFQKAVAGLGAWPAQALFALLFAAVHWGNPNLGGPARAWATLNIALAALLLGLAYLRTGSLALDRLLMWCQSGECRTQRRQFAVIVVSILLKPLQLNELRLQVLAKALDRGKYLTL